ncbi:MAG TPA: tetraacyldisaccharide 4'-kinase [Longimicrobiales bacterium]|nr:tetraacyldisaccharide 4'-kinase [Longimicrobiales bacterium]
MGRGAAFVHRWWRGEAGWPGRALDLALAPAELLFRGGEAAYHAAYSGGLLGAERVAAPVVSVGNLTVGGAGKTPVTRWLVDELLRRGARPAVLHGGYAADEPALHARWHPGVPVVAERDRRTGARRALDAGATVLVLDDGFQHRRLARDLDIVLVAAERWSARPRLLPRGPWREAPAALVRADVVVVTRRTATPEAAAAVAAEVRRFAPGAVPAVVALRAAGWLRWRGGAPAGPGPGRVEPDPRRRPAPDGAEAGAPAAAVGAPRGVAVSGIAEPGAFLAQARASGAVLTASLEFRDHHEYTARDAERIVAAAAGAAVLTTAKDAVKLEPLLPGVELWVLEQEVVVEAGAADLASALADLVAGMGGGLA